MKSLLTLIVFSLAIVNAASGNDAYINRAATISANHTAI